jgi:Leishmanolysin
MRRFLPLFLFFVACNNTQVIVPPTQPQQNSAPVINGAVTANPTSGVTPLSSTFSWSVADADSDALICTFDFDGNGVDKTINPCPATGSETFTFTKAGSSTPQFSVSDGKAAPVSTSAPLITASASPTPVDNSFQIVLQFSSKVEAKYRTIFQDAVNRWQSIIVADIPDFNQAVPLGDCLPGFTTVSKVDDVIIAVDVFTEVRGGLLGQAGPCYVRNSLLPIAGVMRFDTADLDGLASSGTLDETIIHEMGHVLGIGTLWEDKGLTKLANPNRDPTICDTAPKYVGTKGKLEWQALGKTGDVPLEEQYGTGTCEGHWDEQIFAKELMTGFLNSGTNPLSRLSIASLEDLGYIVNYVPADVYALLTAPIRLEPQVVAERQHTAPFKPIGVLR